MNDWRAEQNISLDLAIVLDTLGDVPERDRVATLWLDRERDLASSRARMTESMLREINDLRSLFSRMPRATV